MNFKSTGYIALSAALLTTPLFAQDKPVPQGIPHLDHVFMIMMENHGYGQIVNNPNAPFLNRLAKSANSATNYYAIGHPSLTNYLEVVGGSNFGVRTDNPPDWHNLSCTTNLASGMVATDTPTSPKICPIWGSGTDAATPAIDCTNEVSGPPCENDIDGVRSVAADAHIVGKTIADELVDAGMSWKAYEEALPIGGADRVDASDGVYTNLTDFTKVLPALNPPLTQSSLVSLYASKHDPFAYFRSVEEGYDARNSLRNIVDFDGARGLYADLATGHVPTFSFIAPDQCNDQHGRGNAGAFCNYDPTSNGTQAGSNPALIYRGDVAAQRIVTAIKRSPAWHEGKDAIVILWDENDYSTAPNVNQVLVIVDTNYGVHGLQSDASYTHFSLLKTLDAGFGLPCLNHACDADAHVMADLFAMGKGDRDGDDEDEQ